MGWRSQFNPSVGGRGAATCVRLFVLKLVSQLRYIKQLIYFSILTHYGVTRILMPVELLLRHKSILFTFKSVTSMFMVLFKLYFSTRAYQGLYFL